MERWSNRDRWKRQRALPSVVHSPCGPKNQGCARLKSEARQSINASQAYGTGPSNWTSSPAFSGSLARNQMGSRRDWDLNWHPYWILVLQAAALPTTTTVALSCSVHLRLIESLLSGIPLIEDRNHWQIMQRLSKTTTKKCTLFPFTLHCLEPLFWPYQVTRKMESDIFSMSIRYKETDVGKS